MMAAPAADTIYVHMRPSQERARFDYAHVEVLLLCGGYGSGKTRLMAEMAIQECLEQPGNYVCIASATYPQLKRGILREVFKVATEWGVEHRHNKNENLIRFPDTGSEIQLQSLDIDPTHLKGPEFGALFIDELDGCGREHVQMMLARVRKPGFTKLIRLACNPPSRGHWIVKDFLTEPVAGYGILRSNTYENREVLGEQVIRRYEAMYPPGTNAYRRYLLGEIGVPMEGAVYPEFSDAVMMEVDEFEALCRAGKVIGYACGLDFGANHPLCWLMAAITEADELIVCAEHYAQHMPIEQHWERIMDKIAHGGGSNMFPTVYADTAQLQDRIEFEFRGLPTAPAPKHLGVEHGINTIKRRIINGTLRIVSGAAPNLVEQFATYVWAKPSREGIAYRDEPVKVNDDAQDALRYLVTGHDHSVETNNLDILRNTFARV